MQQADVLFLSDMAKYLNNDPATAAFPHSAMPNLAWWSWNPNSGDTGGLVENDWLTVSGGSAIPGSCWLHSLPVGTATLVK